MKIYLVVGAVLLLLLSACQQSYTAYEGEQGSVDAEMPAPGEDAGEMVVGDDSGEEAEAGQLKTFVLTGENFRFIMDGAQNPDLRVNVGDRVRIEFTSDEGFHDWTVDEFNAATSKVNAGQSAFVEFTADSEGTFEYYCSVGSHRAAGMKGRLIVE